MINTIPHIQHKINERVVLLKETDKDTVRFLVRRIADGYYFDPGAANFVAATDSNTIDMYWFTMASFYDEPDLKTYSLVTLPGVMQDLLFEYEEYNQSLDASDNIIVASDSLAISYERHIFGGHKSVAEPTLCTVFGTLKDVSGQPLKNQKVEAYLNKAGYFTHKAGLIGYAATALTDDTGYFELPLVVGLDVTISVPIVGFTTRGYVPNTGSVELTTQTLLSYQPSQ